MSDAAPPLWVKRAPGLSAAHKFMLGVLWGYGPYKRDGLWIEIEGDLQPRAPARCWETCPELAELTGQSPATVRSQLRKLAADGWILRGTGTMRTLAWRAPGVFAYGALANSQHPPVTGQQGEGSTPPGDWSTPPVESSPPRVANSHPHNVPVPSNQLPSNVEGDAPAPATHESEKPAHGQDTRRTMAGSPPVAGAPAPGGVPSQAMGAVNPRAAAAANEHLGSKLEAHRARIGVAQQPPDQRSDLSPEVWAAITEHGYSMTAQSRQWCGWLLGCMDSEDLDVGDVARLFEARNREGLARVRGCPSRDRLWSYKSAEWRKSQRANDDAYNFTGEDILADLDAGVGS